jgi:hypothetical protein
MARSKDEQVCHATKWYARSVQIVEERERCFWNAHIFFSPKDQVRRRGHGASRKSDDIPSEQGLCVSIKVAVLLC